MGDREPQVGESDRVAPVVAFLARVLADGRVAVAELDAKARAAGFLGDYQRVTHSKRFKRAKRTLGIHSVRAGFGAGGEWSWALPAQRNWPVVEGPGHLSAELPAPIAGRSEDQRTPAAAVVTYANPSPILVPSDARRSMSTGFEFRDSGLVPPEWISGIAYLDHRNALKDVPLHRWRQFLSDCNVFMYGSEHWAARAAVLGWRAEDLFGFHRSGALAYLGSAGLLWLVAGGNVAKLHKDHAFIDAARGDRQVFNRRLGSANVILPWRAQ